MNDDQGKLIAKIQYFYDFMGTHLSSVETSYMNDIDKTAMRERAIVLNQLLFEYHKTFENFIYKEPVDAS